jgi:hypothetical protein
MHQTIHEDVKRRRFREVTFVISHIHKITDYVSESWQSRWTVHYNTFSVTVAIPVYGLRSKRQEIYCPYCRRTIVLIVDFDRAFRIRSIIAWFILLCTIVGLGAFGYHKNGMGGLMAGVIGGLLLDLTVGLIAANIIVGHQFSVQRGHQIKSISKTLA